MDTASNTNIKIFITENKTSIFWTELPEFNNLCEIWSVPPVVGETLFLIL